jgi:hypothetical protein
LNDGYQAAIPSNWLSGPGRTGPTVEIGSRAAVVASFGEASLDDEVVTDGKTEFAQALTEAARYRSSSFDLIAV